MVQPSDIVPGVRWTIHTVHTDDRGSLAEAAVDSTLQLLTGQHIRQVNASVSKTGVLRGMHYHRYQTDAWYVAQGTAEVKVATEDLQSDSRILFPGHGVIIPPNVGHGFLAMTDLVLIYAVTKEFDPVGPDEYTYEAEAHQWSLPPEEWVRSKRDADASWRAND
jgi:dTDP-4-dehydrorhamnose 3,5-epimerase-like enzyme